MGPFIPKWLEYLLAIAAVIWCGHLLVSYGRDIEAKACHIKQADQALTTSEDHRADEDATTTKRGEAADEHVQAIKTLVDQRNAADLSAERLRRQLAETVRVAQRCAANDAAAEQSRAAIAALGTVFAACTAEYRAVAAEAGERYAAGIHAERDYDALTAGDAITPDKGSGQ